MRGRTGVPAHGSELPVGGGGNGNSGNNENQEGPSVQQAIAKVMFQVNLAIGKFNF